MDQTAGHIVAAMAEVTVTQCMVTVPVILDILEHTAGLVRGREGGREGGREEGGEGEKVKVIIIIIFQVLSVFVFLIFIECKKGFYGVNCAKK